MFYGWGSSVWVHNMHFKEGLRGVGLWERLCDGFTVSLCIWLGDFLLVALGAGPGSTWPIAVFDWRAWGSSWHLSVLVPCTLRWCHLPGFLWHSNCVWVYVCEELIGIANMTVAGFGLFTSLSLDKSLNCIPKITPKVHSLIGHWLIPEAKHQGPAITIHHLVILAYLSNHVSPTNPSTDFPCLLKTHLLLALSPCLIQSQAPNSMIPPLGQ